MFLTCTTVFVPFPTVQMASLKFLLRHNHHNLLLSGLDVANIALLIPSQKAAREIQSPAIPCPHPITSLTANLGSAEGSAVTSHHLQRAAIPAPKTSTNSLLGEHCTGTPEAAPKCKAPSQEAPSPPWLQNPVSTDGEDAATAGLLSALRLLLWIIIIF